MGKIILIGAIFGGVIGWLMGFNVFLGLFLGAIVGGISHGLNATRKKATIKDENEPQRMELREEQLDIKKERVKVGEVNIHKEIIEDQKTFSVPIKREELVVEAGSEEEFRIPLKEEEVEITKHPVKVTEVSISKQQVKEMKQVKDTIKKEKVRIEITGVADVKDREE